MSRCKLCTVYFEAAHSPGGRSESPMQTVHSHTQSDGCSTDPEPDMETRQAHFRNMRSKCRCSCVLQFTRHHGVSSVLHRPPSQMIHCIVLCSGFLDLRPEIVLLKRTSKCKGWLNFPTRGDHKPGSRRGLFEPFQTSHNSPHNSSKRGTVPRQTRAVLTTSSRQ